MAVMPAAFLPALMWGANRLLRCCLDEFPADLRAPRRSRAWPGGPGTRAGRRRPGRPVAWVLLGAGALERAAENQAALRGQPRHLLALAAAGQAVIQLVPEGLPEAVQAPHSFTLVRYAAPGRADVVLLAPAGRCRQAVPDAGQHYLRQFSRLAAASMTPGDSLRALADGLPGDSGGRAGWR